MPRGFNAFEKTTSTRLSSRLSTRSFNVVHRRHRFKKRYAGEYEGMSTTELAGDLRRDVEHYRGLWRTARGADEKVNKHSYCRLSITRRYKIRLIVKQTGEKTPRLLVDEK